MDSFLYWSGAALWTVLGAILALVALSLLREALWSAVFVSRLVRSGGWREGTPAWKKPWRFLALTWREMTDPTTVYTNQETGEKIYHPLYKGHRAGNGARLPWEEGDG